MEKELKNITKQYWEKEVTAYTAAQKMKKSGLCKHDMDCYRKLLTAVGKHYR